MPPVNTQTQDPGDDDVVYLNPGQDEEDDVYLTDPGPARDNGGGCDPDITSAASRGS